LAKIAQALTNAIEEKRQSGAAGSATARTLASGDGWRVADVICTSGPDDRPFEEQHQQISIAVVAAGTFQYRTAHTPALMTAGSFFLGHPGLTFECAHDHGTGDRCISFQFTPDYFERITNTKPRFHTQRLPPMRESAALAARACATLEQIDRATGNPPTSNSATGNSATSNSATNNPATGNPATNNPPTNNPATGNPATNNPPTSNSATGNPATNNPPTNNSATGNSATNNSATLHELAIAVAMRTVELANDVAIDTQPAPLHATSRVTRAIRAMQRHPDADISLQMLADDAGLSPFHFLRTFTRLTGVTPHQFVMRARLREAALRLTRDDERIIDIAFDCGFGDVSNFNRAFRNEFGVSPRSYRKETFRSPSKHASL